MRFEKTNFTFGDRAIGGGTAELYRVFCEFLESGIKVAELKDWEDYYKSVGVAQSSAYLVVKRFFDGRIRVGRSGDRLFIERL